MPKQEGHATVAKRAPQCSQRVASVAAAAPHIGQFKVSAGIIYRQLTSQNMLWLLLRVKSKLVPNRSPFWNRDVGGIDDWRVICVVAAPAFKIGSKLYMQDSVREGNTNSGHRNLFFKSVFASTAKPSINFESARPNSVGILSK